MLLLLASSALALPLLVERFDSPALSPDWKVKVVAGKGGAQSALAVEEGALVIRAAPKAKRFVAATHTYELRNVSWIRVQARVRTEGVAPSAAPCGVYLRFEGGEPRADGQCGSAEGKDVVRTFAVPQGARDVEVGLYLPTAGTAWIDEVIVEPVTPDWRTVVRGPVEYHWLASEAFREDQLVANEETFDKVVALFGAAPKGRVAFHHYPDLAAIEEYTGARRDVQVDAGGAVRSIFKSDPRAVAAGVARAFGDPPPFLADGLALSFAGEYDGRELRQAARQLAAKGEAPGLDVLLDPAKYAAMPADARAWVSGAYAQWLIEAKGPEVTRALYAALRQDTTVEANRAAMEKALGTTLAEADAAARAWW